MIIIAPLTRTTVTVIMLMLAGLGAVIIMVMTGATIKIEYFGFDLRGSLLVSTE